MSFSSINLVQKYTFHQNYCNHLAGRLPFRTEPEGTERLPRACIE